MNQKEVNGFYSKHFYIIFKLDQIKDKYYGTVGNPKRDKLESEMATLRIDVKLRNDVHF